jgi:asparagine synthase (glutamine-hydrolysing)
MLAGAWGVRAGELLEQAAERHQARIHRVGELAMLAAPDIVQEKWCCWLFGEPEDRGELSTRFGLRSRDELPTAFGRALTELGGDSFGLLCGRFVLVVVDRERAHCLVVRDQLGAQPLVYASFGDGVLFAEHERDLLDLLPATPSPDRLALLRWIDNGLIPHGHTFYGSVQRLPAGHRLTFGEGRTQVERWWSICYQGTDRGSPMVLGEHLRDVAFAAVGRAAAGSRRPAVKLSGGLDSACVAAGLTANGFADGRALAIGGTFSDHPVTDERELIEATARHTTLPLEQIAFKSDSSMFAPALEHITRWRLPPATPNLFLWQPVMARARELGVDLILDGEGGDELFGLARYLIADRVRTGRVLGAWLLTRRIPGLGAHPDRRLRLRVLRRYGLAPLVPSAVQHRREQRRIASSSSIVPRADAQTLLDLRIADEQDRHDGPLWWRYQVESVIDLRDTFDMGGHFRREAADAAIDIRHPLLYDLPLIEAALRLPPRAQFDPLRDRPLLREGLSGLIPEAVRTRHEKSHFTPLVLAGISAEEARLIEPLLGANAPIRAYVAPEALDRKIAVDPDARSILGAGSLWRVAIANRWLVSQAG